MRRRCIYVKKHSVLASGPLASPEQRSSILRLVAASSAWPADERSFQGSLKPQPARRLIPRAHPPQNRSARVSRSPKRASLTRGGPIHSVLKRAHPIFGRRPSPWWKSRSQKTMRARRGCLAGRGTARCAGRPAGETWWSIRRRGWAAKRP